MTARAKLIVGGIVAAAFFGWAGFVLWQRWHQLPTVDLDGSRVLIGVLLAWSVVCLNSMLVEFCAKRTGRGIGLLDSQALGFVVTFANYFLPLRAGLGIRVGYYVRRAGQDVVRFSAVLIAATVIMQLVSVLGIALVFLKDQEGRWASVAVFGALLGTLLLFAVVMALGFHRGNSWLRGTVIRTLEGANALVRDRGHPIVVIAVIAGTVLALTAARYQIEMSFIQGSIGLDAAIAMAAASGLSSLIAVTFGGLGVREAAVVVIGRLCGIPVEMCLMLALVDRVLVSTALAVTGIPAIVLGRHFVGGKAV